MQKWAVIRPSEQCRTLGATGMVVADEAIQSISITLSYFKSLIRKELILFSPRLERLSFDRPHWCFHSPHQAVALRTAISTDPMWPQ